MVCVAESGPQNVSYTVKRISEDSVRVMGDGTDGPSRIGTSFCLDEFFVVPKPCENDCVIYFPKDSGTDSQPRYGFQLSIDSILKPMPGAPPFPPLQHVRSIQDVPKTTLKTKASDVSVRVVTGSFAGVSAPPPLTSGVTMLDIEMGPEDEVLLPVDSRRGVLVYVLEGVAMFDTAMQDVTNYTNEGHAIYYWQPINEDPDASPVPLRVRTHPCSTVQFILLANDSLGE